MAVLATKQYGVVNRTQLAALGFGGRAIQIRLRDGHLHPLHRGVYAVGHERVNQQGTGWPPFSPVVTERY